MTMLRHTGLVAGWFGAALSLGCAAGSTDPGLDAELRVEGARFAAGELPAPTGGPEVIDARIPHNSLRIGTRGEPLSGTLAASGNALVLARRGDPGFWIVTAGLPSVDEPDYPTFAAPLDLARDFPPGPFTLELSAVDRAGRVGPRKSLELQAQQSSVQAELLVSLRWDVDADLDLHVVDPAGVEIWSRNIAAPAAPPTAAASSDAGAVFTGGVLDFDSNAQCLIDGRDEENVSWRSMPPPGHYTVRVATASLCGMSAADWTVEVRLHDKLVGSARGKSLPTDTRKSAGVGSGVLALSFAVP